MNFIFCKLKKPQKMDLAFQADGYCTPFGNDGGDFCTEYVGDGDHLELCPSGSSSWITNCDLDCGREKCIQDPRCVGFTYHAVATGLIPINRIKLKSKISGTDADPSELAGYSASDYKCYEKSKFPGNNPPILINTSMNQELICYSKVPPTPTTGRFLSYLQNPRPVVTLCFRMLMFIT